MNMNCDIAIVGLSCRYPDAASADQLWRNVLARRRAFRRMPNCRLRREDYIDTDRSNPDATYASYAAVLDGFRFDREKFKVAGPTYRSADIATGCAFRSPMRR